VIETKCQLRIPFIIRARKLDGYEVINIRDEVLLSDFMEFKCKPLVLDTANLEQRAPSIF
jgi:hypothetical protein